MFDWRMHQFLNTDMDWMWSFVRRDIIWIFLDSLGQKQMVNYQEIGDSRINVVPLNGFLKMLNPLVVITQISLWVPKHYRRFNLDRFH